MAMIEDFQSLLNRVVSTGPLPSASDEPTPSGVDPLLALLVEAGLLADAVAPAAFDAAAIRSSGIVEPALSDDAVASPDHGPADPEPPNNDHAGEDAFAIRLGAAYRSGALDIRPTGPGSTLGRASRVAPPPVNHNEVPVPPSLRRASVPTPEGGWRRHAPLSSVARPLYTPW